jgi:hypothetical protein
MTFHVSTRWHGDEENPTVERLRDVIGELGAEDEEHCSVSLVHETEWCLEAFSGGLLIWENLEDGKTKYLKDMSKGLCCINRNGNSLPQS